jgi:peptidoglycan/xylan/chitin deacetylase (PgdA/CDA1 family)
LEELSTHRLETAETAEQFRGIALTFDLCPVEQEPGFDEPLVSLLVEHQIPATFFVSGRWAARHEAQFRKLLAVPFFDFGTHGYVHAHLPELDRQSQRQEIETAVTLLREHFGRQTTLFRPPFGEYDDLTLQLLDELGLRFVLWDVVSRDPESTLSREEIISGVTKQTRPGSIIVFHANGKGQHTKGVIEEVSTTLTETRLLLPVTVSELLKHRDGPPFRNQKLQPR